VNIKIVLEYDGTNFAGWQQQAHGRTVEADEWRSPPHSLGRSALAEGHGRVGAVRPAPTRQS